jgi:TMEM175 potassium channel family protein
MTTSRMAAFSDGVVAIIITIMVLELPRPEGVEWGDLIHGWHAFAAYAVSFVYVGIYWNNHHHLLHAVKRVNGTVLWANLYLLFWLSLFPFVASWLGENVAAAVELVSMALYAVAVVAPFAGSVGVVLGEIILVVVAGGWLIPDRRIERRIQAV